MIVRIAFRKKLGFFSDQLMFMLGLERFFHLDHPPPFATGAPRYVLQRVLAHCVADVWSRVNTGTRNTAKGVTAV